MSYSLNTTFYIFALKPADVQQPQRQKNAQNKILLFIQTMETFFGNTYIFVWQYIFESCPQFSPIMALNNVIAFIIVIIKVCRIAFFFKCGGGHLL